MENLNNKWLPAGQDHKLYLLRLMTAMVKAAGGMIELPLRDLKDVEAGNCIIPIWDSKREALILHYNGSPTGVFVVGATESAQTQTSAQPQVATQPLPPQPQTQGTPVVSKRSYLLSDEELLQRELNRLHEQSVADLERRAPATIG